MPSGVSCAVNSCTFWDKGNECTADSIQIQTDYLALLRQSKTETEFSVELLERSEEQSLHSVDTCCLTYKPSGLEDDE